MDFIREKLKETSTIVRESSGKALKSLDEGIATASDGLKSGTATATVEAEKAYSRAQTMWETGIEHSKVTEELIFNYMKDAVGICMNHKVATLAAAVSTAAIVLPGPRRFLCRMTIGRFRSEEAVFKSAEQSVAGLREGLEGQAAEQLKLEERLARALEEYDSGLHKLKSTSRQLQSLSRQLAATERSSQSLMQDLRLLPSKQALKLRSDAATHAAAAKKQHAAIEKHLYTLAKRGL